MVGRNDPCPCGSGKKYKKCCQDKEAGFHVNRMNAAPAPDLLLEAVGHHQAGRLAEAEAGYRKLLAREPRNADALHYLGLLAFQRGNFPVAVEFIESALRIKETVPAFHCNLGNAYKRLERYEQAIAAYRRALQLDPGFAAAHCNLGNVYLVSGQSPLAIAPLERAVAINPRFAEAWLALGDAHAEATDLGEAERCYSSAIACRENYPDAHVQLGGTLLRAGRIEQALECFDRAVRLNPDLEGTWEARLLPMNYFSRDPQAIFDAHVAWARRFVREEPARKAHVGLPADRRIRVGYVSADLREHVVRFFIEPILRAHDRDRFEVHCYYNHFGEDEVTLRLKGMTEAWTDCHAMSDAQLAQKIRDDGIDVLVDLSGHTSRNRLHTFALRPAPVQVTYLGYPNTTGLSSIDYRLTDDVADPPGATERYHTERLVRLPGGFLCYQPPEDAPDVGPLPAESNGYVTFGSFNNITKAVAEAVPMWAALLSRVPDARLLLKSPSLKASITQREVLRRFEERGIAPERITLGGFTDALSGHLAHYNQVDIALDTFPYNGTTTTCESLWMGVPVVTLAGQSHVSRVGASLLSRVGLTELIAPSAEAYLETAAALAGDRPRLAALRRDLRGRMGASALCDASGFVRHLEQAYLHMLA